MDYIIRFMYAMDERYIRKIKYVQYLLYCMSKMPSEWASKSAHYFQKWVVR